jgi:hypothetical protein
MRHARNRIFRFEPGVIKPVLCLTLLSVTMLSARAVACEVTSVTSLKACWQQSGDFTTEAEVCECVFWVKVEWFSAGPGDLWYDDWQILIKEGATSIGSATLDWDIDGNCPGSSKAAVLAIGCRPAGTHVITARVKRVGTTAPNEWEESPTCTVHIVKVGSVTVDKTKACVGEDITFTAHPAPAEMSLYCIEWQKRYRPESSSSWGPWVNTTGGITAVLNTTEAGWYQYRPRNGCCGSHVASPPVLIYDIKVVNVDAINPNGTKINYETIPFEAATDTVYFSAPGKTDSKSSVSGSFHFTYDQADVPWGTHTISLTFCSNSRNCTVTKTNKMEEATETLSAYFLVKGVGLRLYGHTLHETYNKHTYSAPYSGKTVKTLSSIVLMCFGADYNYIIGWAEQHEYRWTGGTSGWVTMAVGSGWLPPNTSCRECNTAIWCIPDELVGVGKCVALMWDYGGGTTPGVITNAEVDCPMP